MTELGDHTVDHLRRVVGTPDLSGTRYRIRSFIASGGMGDVYLAEDATLGRDVALKVLGVAGGADAAARMRREAEIIARLEHPAIVPVHDAGTLPDGRVFYVMKRVQGRRLDAYAGSREISLAERLETFRRICDAVAFAHAHGVVHRDLKPANVMVGSFGEVLVMDWGLAKVVGSTAPDLARPDPEAETIVSPDPGADVSSSAAPGAHPIEPGGATATAHGTVMGTPGYMAPEQAAGDVSRIDARTDVFALGAILEALATPARDEIGRTSRSLAAGKRLDAIVRKARAERPEDRYPGADALAEDVRRWEAGDPIDAHPEHFVERTARVIVRYRVPILLILAYVAARAAVFFFSGR